MNRGYDEYLKIFTKIVQRDLLLYVERIKEEGSRALIANPPNIEWIFSDAYDELADYVMRTEYYTEEEWASMDELEQDDEKSTWMQQCPAWIDAMPYDFINENDLYPIFSPYQYVNQYLSIIDDKYAHYCEYSSEGALLCSAQVAWIKSI